MNANVALLSIFLALISDANPEPIQQKSISKRQGDFFSPASSPLSSNSVNRPPELVSGGDFLDFSGVSENTPTGQPIYTLRAVDKEGDEIRYSISGDEFSVDEFSGVVTLRDPLDREDKDSIEVVISVQDEAQNLVAYRRLIKVLDINDNSPKFSQRSYLISLPETVRGGEGIVVYDEIRVTDTDSGVNAEIELKCDDSEEADNNVAKSENANVRRNACDVFDVYTQEIKAGFYAGRVVLKGEIDYESRTYYKFNVTAIDNYYSDTNSRRHETVAEVIVRIEDIQDQVPRFINPPYVKHIRENTPEGTKVFDVEVRDGDTGNPRQVLLSLDGDDSNYFTLTQTSFGEDDLRFVAKAEIHTSSNPLDRETPAILHNSGIYKFKIEAKEIVSFNELTGTITAFGDVSFTDVSIVVLDEDDHLPQFDEDVYEFEVPESIENDARIPGPLIVIEDNDSSDHDDYQIMVVFNETQNNSSEVKEKVVHSELSETLKGELVKKDISERPPKHIPFPETKLFYVTPQHSSGKTYVDLHVSNTNLLDYESEDRRHFEFEIRAVRNSEVLSFAKVKINVTDVNDNDPVLAKKTYQFYVDENTKPGTLIGEVNGTDADSGKYGVMTYTINGFGSEHFDVNSRTGKIRVNSCSIRRKANSKSKKRRRQRSCLNYEKQKLYSLTFTAEDGGGRKSTSYLIVNIKDVNDNRPKFDEEEYLRVVKVGDVTFVPPLIAKATDADAVNEGNGRVVYSIDSTNVVTENKTIFDIDPVSGEITFVESANPNDTSHSEYKMIVKGSDMGRPNPLFTYVNVTVRVVGGPNGYHMSKINAKRPHFEQDVYEVMDNEKVNEYSPPGTVVTVVVAKVQSEPSKEIRYHLLSGGKDNFDVHEQTGIIMVSRNANLDIQRNEGDLYELIVEASCWYDINTVLYSSEFGDATNDVLPNNTQRLTSQTKVAVKVMDVNDKPPKLLNQNKLLELFTMENVRIGTKLTTIRAVDVDVNAKLKYSIVEPIYGRDKTGNLLSQPTSLNLSSSFAIDSNNGELKVVKPLSYDLVAMMGLTVKVEDISFDSRFPNQSDTMKLVVFIEAFDADSPHFSLPWSPSNPILKFEVDEELPPGSLLFTIRAFDPLTGDKISSFKQMDDVDNLISVSPATGDVINNVILDFESIKRLEFTVMALARAIGNDSPGDAGSKKTRSSQAKIQINIKDVNDHAPKFENQILAWSVSEGALPMTEIGVIKASDEDTGRFGEVRYSLRGGGEKYFEIDSMTGSVKVRSNEHGRTYLDREEKDTIEVHVIAADMPDGGYGQMTSVSKIVVNVIDINDTPPIFTRNVYSAVITENSLVNTPIISVSAEDKDLGSGGQVWYTLVPNTHLISSISTGPRHLFRIDDTTGELFTNAPLTGKGRSEPYIIRVRATDNGVEELYSETEVFIVVGDISPNDGIPYFLSPALNDIAYVQENSIVGTKVFQATAEDPDDVNTPNGKIVYSISNETPDIHKLFKVDADTGALVTRVELDREQKADYTIILYASDLGSPAQYISRILQVHVTDSDDHKPVFNRQKNSQPIVLEIEENIPLGTVIGHVEAIDEDIDDNSLVDYEIIDGNHQHNFMLRVSERNNGTQRDKRSVPSDGSGPKVTHHGVDIVTMKAIDREAISRHMLTIKCFRPYERSVKAHAQQFEKNNFDEMQVEIRVIDMDDNSPIFEQKQVVVGARANSPVDSILGRVSAHDFDGESEPILYKIHNVTFYRKRTKNHDLLTDKGIFTIDKASGVIRTNASFNQFADGYFMLYITASNGINDDRIGHFTALQLRNERRISDTATSCIVWIYVLQDADLLKIVFDRDPAITQSSLKRLTKDIQEVLPQPLQVYMYDTQFYSEFDGSLDFGRSSTCIQLISPEDNHVLNLTSARNVLDLTSNIKLQKLMNLYDVIKIERCSNIDEAFNVGNTEFFLLLVGILLGLFSVMASILLCCLHSRFQKSIASECDQARMINNNYHTHAPSSMRAPSIIPSAAGGGNHIDATPPTLMYGISGRDHDHHRGGRPTAGTPTTDTAAMIYSSSGGMSTGSADSETSDLNQSVFHSTINEHNMHDGHGQVNNGYDWQESTMALDANSSYRSYR